MAGLAGAAIVVSLCPKAAGSFRMGLSHTGICAGSFAPAEAACALAPRLREHQGRLAALSACFESVEVPPEQMQPLLDLRRAERRLADSLMVLRAF